MKENGEIYSCSIKLCPNGYFYTDIDKKDPISEAKAKLINSSYIRKMKMEELEKIERKCQYIFVLNKPDEIVGDNKESVVTTILKYIKDIKKIIFKIYDVYSNYYEIGNRSKKSRVNWGEDIDWTIDTRKYGKSSPSHDYRVDEFLDSEYTVTNHRVKYKRQIRLIISAGLIYNKIYKALMDNNNKKDANMISVIAHRMVSGEIKILVLQENLMGHNFGELETNKLGLKIYNLCDKIADINNKISINREPIDIIWDIVNESKLRIIPFRVRCETFSSKLYELKFISDNSMGIEEVNNIIDSCIYRDMNIY